MSSHEKADEATNLLPRTPLRQYHYIYGSSPTSDRPEIGSVGTHSPTATDQESLVGETILSTDNEQDDVTPLASEGDLQQLLMTNGNGMTHFLEANGHHTNKKGFRFNIFDSLRVRQSQTMLYGIVLAGIASLLVFILAVILLPSAARFKSSDTSFNMPFAKVDRGDYGDPVANFMDKTLFDPGLVNRRGRKEFIFPFPTGSFWTNLVLPPTADRGISYPIVVYPYAYAWSSSLLQVSYPACHRREEPKMIHDYFFPDLTLTTTEKVLNRHIFRFDPLSVALRFSTLGGKWESYLVQGSPYTTVRYENASPEIHAYSTFAHVGCNNYQDLSGNSDGSSRRLGDSSGFGVCVWEDDSTGTQRKLRGVQFRITSQERIDWIVFSSEPIELTYDLVTKTSISSVDKFNGVLRIALIPGLQSGETTFPAQTNSQSGAFTNSSMSTGLQRLVYHAGVYPVGGDISWSFQSTDTETATHSTKNILGTTVTTSSVSSSSASSHVASSSNAVPTRISRIVFQFTTESFTPSASGSTTKPLLMLGLPHHAQKLSPGIQLGNDQFDLVFKCIKGIMQPLIGSMWTYDEILLSIGLDDFDLSENHRKGYLDPKVQALLVNSLKKDIDLALPTVTENVYGFAKQTARLAQLAHIAYRLHDGNKTGDIENDITDIFQRAFVSLSNSLEHFLNNTVSDAIVFDENLGGLVSSDGIRDSGADFGNGRYNDHHFHYGYLLYSCAILGNIDPGFVNRYGGAVDAIYRDIAHDRNFKSEKSEHVFFPGSRHKIWFDGHSFASGMFPFGNGKSQESSSEAVNAYFGAYLWSLVKHRSMLTPHIDTSSQTDFARLLLATEIRGAQMYWHMQPPDNNPKNATTIYSPEFAKNYMVGNLGMLDAVSSTWFGTSSLYVHMINEMPVTGITSTLFNTQFVEAEYANAIRPLGDVEMAWRGYVICNRALIDPTEAWKEAQDLESGELDSAISKSQILYFISTRSGFDPSVLSLHRVTDVDSEVTPQSSGYEFSNEDLSSCLGHKACHRTGLTGLCCPTREGVLLECCSL